MLNFKLFCHRCNKKRKKIFEKRFSVGVGAVKTAGFEYIRFRYKKTVPLQFYIVNIIITL